MHNEGATYGEVYLKTYSLGAENYFNLHQIFMIKENYTEIKTMFIMHNNCLVTQNYMETLEFFSMLEALIKKNLITGDENRYLSYRQQKNDRDIIKSLQLKCDKSIYISAFQAMSMCQIFYESKAGLSTRVALETDIPLELPYMTFPFDRVFQVQGFEVSEFEKIRLDMSTRSLSKKNEYFYNLAKFLLYLDSLKKTVTE
ncbi:hypothetical protein [Sulfurovum sp.]|uniref:hypothetical protein n=1 Tax=Sulfurovum sp. TaxID=1969726 RepID=UPI00356687D4